jgi:hypothetical protein
MTVKGINQNRSYITSGRHFERVKKEAAQAHSVLLSGKKRIPFTEEHRANISKSKKGKPGANKGKKFSEEHRKNIGIASKGRISGDKNPMRNKEVLANHPTLFSNGNNPSKIRKKCPHCEVTCGMGNYVKWHGDNCKNKKDE